MIEQKHVNDRHENDFYATHPDTVELFIKNYPEFKNYKNCLEPCAGLGHMVSVTSKYVPTYTNELYNYGEFYNKCNFHEDFLNSDLELPPIDCVIMNPPFKLTSEFIEKAFEYSDNIIVLQKLSFLEGNKRYNDLYSKGYLKEVLVCKSRQLLAKSGDFDKYNKPGAIAFAWFIFDKHNTEQTKLRWI